MSSKSRIDDCKCQCLPHMNTYREDLGICVDDIHGKFFFFFFFLYIKRQEVFLTIGYNFCSKNGEFILKKLLISNVLSNNNKTPVYIQIFE